jgi:hypothetical protein
MSNECHNGYQQTSNHPLLTGRKEAALNLFALFFSPFAMLQTKTRIESVLDLSARLLEKNKAFTNALKARKPQHELKTIHSEIQELYNHISLLNRTAKTGN